MEALITAEGSNGQVTLYEHFLVITRKGVLGFLNHGFDGGKFIFLKSITAVQYKAPGKLSAGFIQFVFPGSQESKKGLWEAISDENSVTINQDQEGQFKQLLEFVLKQAESVNMRGNLC